MTQRRSFQIDEDVVDDGGRSYRFKCRLPHWGDLLALAALLLLIASAIGVGDHQGPQPSVLASPGRWLPLGGVIDGGFSFLGSPRRVVLLVHVSSGTNEVAGSAMSKSAIVKRGVTQFLHHLPESTVVGLRGSRHGRRVCASSDQIRPPTSLGPDEAAQIAAQLDQMSLRGDMPLAPALEAAAADLGPLGGQVILITDGVDTCGGVANVCDSVRGLMTSETPVRIDVLHVLTAPHARQALTCVSQDTAGTIADWSDGTVDSFTASLLRMVPLGYVTAVLLLVFGWLTFFALCELLAEALGCVGLISGAGFVSDIVFVLLAGGWATFWLLQLAHLPFVFAIVIVLGLLTFLYREIPRRRSALLEG